MWMKWTRRDNRRFIRRACYLVCVPFVALLVALQTGWLFEVTDKQGLLAIVGTVAAVTWFVPHIAVFAVAWRHDGEIDFGPLGKQSGRSKRGTLVLLFLLEAVLLPALFVLGTGWFDRVGW